MTSPSPNKIQKRLRFMTLAVGNLSLRTLRRPKNAVRLSTYQPRCYRPYTGGRAGNPKLVVRGVVLP